MVDKSRVLYHIAHMYKTYRNCLTLAVADMLEGVKGGDRLGAPARLNRFITTNLRTQQPISTPYPRPQAMSDDCSEKQPPSPNKAMSCIMACACQHTKATPPKQHRLHDLKKDAVVE